MTRAPKRGGRSGETGRHVKLEIEVGPRADIGDMLKLAVRTQPPVMHGRLKLETGFDLPAGEGSVTQRMRLKGRFRIEGATFTNAKVQGRVDGLSLRAQGRPKEVKGAGEREPIASEMEGNFLLDDARLTLSGLEYRVPGAEIGLDGVYSLDGRVYDFAGTARMEAHVSQMVTGWKSWLLKPVDPFLAKHGAGTEVPFTVTGTEGEPKIGLAWFGRGQQQR